MRNIWAECITYLALGKKQGVMIGFSDGTIGWRSLDRKEKLRRFTDNHQLKDGSTVSKVHEFSVQMFSPHNLDSIVFARVTTNKGDQVVLSINFSTTELSKSILGRKHSSTEPANQFHMLDYDFERIQFSQISSDINSTVAID